MNKEMHERLFNAFACFAGIAGRNAWVSTLMLYQRKWSWEESLSSAIGQGFVPAEFEISMMLFSLAETGKKGRVDLSELREIHSALRSQLYDTCSERESVRAFMSGLFVARIMDGPLTPEKLKDLEGWVVRTARRELQSSAGLVESSLYDITPFDQGGEELVSRNVRSLIGLLCTGELPETIKVESKKWAIQALVESLSALQVAA